MEITANFVHSLQVQAGAAEAMQHTDTKLFQAAKGLEAQFISHMLQEAGFGEARESFGGGHGEAQFSSILASEYAEAMVESGGIGLAELIYQSLVKRQRDASL